MASCLVGGKMKYEIPVKLIKMAKSIKAEYEKERFGQKEKPVYIVFSTRRIIINDEITNDDPYLDGVDTRMVYVYDCHSGDVAEAGSKAELKSIIEIDDEIFNKDKVRTYTTQLVSKFEMLFFTRPAAVDWIKENPRLENPFIYELWANMGNGGNDIAAVYDFLKGIAETHGEKNGN